VAGLAASNVAWPIGRHGRPLEGTSDSKGIRVDRHGFGCSNRGLQLYAFFLYFKEKREKL